MMNIKMIERQIHLPGATELNPVSLSVNIFPFIKSKTSYTLFKLTVCQLEKLKNKD